MSVSETPLTNYEAIQRLTAGQTSLLNDAEYNPAKRQLTILDRTLSYLRDTPAVVQTAKSVMEMMTALDKFNITDTEKISIINLRPITSIDVQVSIEEAVDRFNEETIEKLATLSSKILPNFSFFKTQKKNSLNMDYENDPGWKYLRRTRDEMLKDQSRPYDSKKNFWMPDAEEGYIAVELSSVKGDTATVNVPGGFEKTCKKDLLQEMNPPKFEKTEDMSNLTFLNDASVLHNLRSRYAAMLIYTYSGLFCVVINPYKRLPIYTDSVARMFMGKRRTEMPPHLFAVSDEAYRNMLQNHENQSMLITGESGAGKTENTKKVIAYFAAVGASQQETADAMAGTVTKVDEKKVTLEDQIVQTNPVLEAFGNAKTVRNNNSSRFGKFIRIHFSKKGRVASCDIEHYLLEKSRVIRQAPGERCYHIFYQIYSDFKPNLKKELLLNKPLKNYWFVAQAELTIDGINDTEEFQLTDEAFDILNFSAEEKNNVYRLCAAMMHMGNMKFKQRPREEQAEADGTEDAENAAKMYGVDVDEFLKAFLRPRVKVGNEWVNKGQNMDQVYWAIGAMAKGLYARIFHWLVVKCNMTLDQQGISRDYFIGVLDIAGFEIFDFNSFEQLWINFVNEKLQQFFNHHMFVLEQEEYKREGIQWTFIDFGLDLAACIELIEKPMGIIAMLDEECIVPKATDATLAQKLAEQHLGKHPNFEKPKPPKGKQAEAHFAMRHYAGTVRYNVSNWLEKNKDPLNDTVVTVMKASKENVLLNTVWADYTTQEEAVAAAAKGGKGAPGGKKKGKSGSFMTVSMLYRESLNKLMTMLNSTHPHFIRCIIPNEKKQCGVIDAALVLNQLTCNGVLEGIRICRKGFPNRTLHPDFVERYAILAADEAKSSTDKLACVKSMFARLEKEGKIKSEQYRIGLTKVFFKAGVVAHMEDMRDIRLAELITGFQAQIKSYYAIIDVKKRREQLQAMLKLQSNVRQWLQLKNWIWFKLYVKVRPLLEAGKEQEKIDALAANVEKLKDSLTKETSLLDEISSKKARLLEERELLFKELEGYRAKQGDVTAKMSSVNEAKAALEKEIVSLNDAITIEEQKYAEILKQKKILEGDVDAVKKAINDMELTYKKSEAEKNNRENQIRSLQEELNQQDITLAKLNKERRHQDDNGKKMAEDLAREEERTCETNRIRQKLQQTMEDAENSMEKERRNRCDAEKNKRKMEGELKIVQESLDELSKQRQDAEISLRRKEAELHGLSVRLEDEQNLLNKLERHVKEDESRIKELEAELEQERESRVRSEKAKNEIQTEIDDLNDQLEQQMSAINSAIEANKKKDVELARLRREVEQITIQHDSSVGVLKKKGSDGSSELNDQIDTIVKQKLKADKEKAALQRQLDEITMQVDEEAKVKVEHERRANILDNQLLELRMKSEEQIRQISDISSAKSRMQGDNSELMRHVEELENQVLTTNKLRGQFAAELEQTRRAAAEESREKQSLSILSKNLEHELEQLRETFEEESSAKNDMLRQLNKAQNEITQWKARYESEGLISAEEMEEIRRKQLAQITDLQAQYDSAVSKASVLEKTKQRLSADVDASRSDSETFLSIINQLEKKQRAFDKICDEWRKRVDDLQNELDAAQRTARIHVTEAHKLRTQQDSLIEQAEGIKRENKALSLEARELSDQVAEGSRNNNELNKTLKRLDLEKDELQKALDEAEAALETEESKVMRAQLEVSQIRAEIEKRIQEKEEEFENTRKNHQRQLEAMQNTLEIETKAKTELLKVKKKLEADANELEISMDHANRANAEAQKNIKRYTEQIRDLQQHIDEEQRRRDEFRDNYLNIEKKLAVAKSEQEEIYSQIENINKARKSGEADLSEQQAIAVELASTNASLITAKNKLENEIALLQADLSEVQNEVVNAEDRCKKASFEAAKLAEELKQQQDKSNQIDRHRKILEIQVKDMASKIDEVESTLIKANQKAIAKLEAKLKSTESDLELEQRRHSDAYKALSKAERKAKEIIFQLDEEKKNYNKLVELTDKLQGKIKKQRRDIEEAEETANSHLAKYRQIQMAYENAEERADCAEHSLVKLRSRSRIMKSDTVA
uniref:Myosin motor domain-containing protein n=1 Tax=Parastrongyloides trichosuri TaxID=131310 RepID=A0A0N4ZXJ8_PARTI